MRRFPDPVSPGKESVWHFPRPAIAETSKRRVRIEHRGVLVADAHNAVRTLEISRPPSRYLPHADLTPGFLSRSGRRSFCEWTGHVVYWHLAMGDVLLRDMGWTYSALPPAFAQLRDHVAFYAAPSGHCAMGGEQVIPQPGDFTVDGSCTADVSRPISLAPSEAYRAARDGEAGAARRSAEGILTCSAQR